MRESGSATALCTADEKLFIDLDPQEGLRRAAISPAIAPIKPIPGTRQMKLNGNPKLGRSLPP